MDSHGVGWGGVGEVGGWVGGGVVEDCGAGGGRGGGVGWGEAVWGGAVASVAMARTLPFNITLSVPLHSHTLPIPWVPTVPPCS